MHNVCHFSQCKAFLNNIFLENAAISTGIQLERNMQLHVAFSLTVVAWVYWVTVACCVTCFICEQVTMYCDRNTVCWLLQTAQFHQRKTCHLHIRAQQSAEHVQHTTECLLVQTKDRHEWHFSFKVIQWDVSVDGYFSAVRILIYRPKEF